MDYAHQRASPRSTMNSELPPQPPKYVMLQDNQGSLRPPPYRRNIPRYLSSNHRSKNGCMKCICCFYLFLFIFVLVLAGISLYFYTVYNPHVPTYNVQNLEIGSFNAQKDFSLYAEFTVTIKAENTNEHIGFIYGKDSSINVMFQESTLCSGKLPSFHQGHKNITMMKVLLKGKSEFGSGFQEALMKSRQSGKVPLLVKVRVPVSILLGSLKLREVVVLVNCALVLDSLVPHKKPRILSSTYEVSAEF